MVFYKTSATLQQASNFLISIIFLWQMICHKKCSSATNKSLVADVNLM